MSTVLKIAQANDPKEGILSQLADGADKIELLGGRCLVAIYVAPEKTAGGIIRTGTNLQEDIYQGSVGLLIKKGKMAFVDDDNNRVYFNGADVKVGEWVAFRPGDGKRIQINGVNCRIMEDTVIDMVLSQPDIITHRK